MAGQGEQQERRTLEELLTLYTLEPEVRDIFVEGRSDKSFLKWHVGNIEGSDSVRVYAISDRVIVPDVNISEFGHLIGERGRILCLAQLLYDNKRGHSSAIFIADKDFASLEADATPQIHGLKFTDFSSMESYAFNERTLSKLLHVSMGAPATVTARGLIEAVTPSLISLFLMRLCLRQSQTGATLSPRTLSKFEITDREDRDVIEAFRIALNQVPADERRGLTPEKLYESYESYKANVDNEPRNFINGHDISTVIVRYLKSTCAYVFNSDTRRAFQAPAVFETLLMSCIEAEDLASMEMFEFIRNWVRGLSAP